MGEIYKMKKEIQSIVVSFIYGKPILVDSFDASYLEEFHHILRENYDIESLQSGCKSHKKLLKLVELLGLSVEDEMTTVTEKLIKILDKDDYLPKISDDSVKDREQYSDIPSWHETGEVKSDSIENTEKVVKFLTEYSQQSSNGNPDLSVKEFTDLHWGRTPELKKIQEEIIKNYISDNSDAMMLTLGPRWAAEIKALRGIFGINVWGLDLFTYDENFIITGDMHDMPFDDNQFDIVYEKNTYNKAYNIRKALDESVRVLKPGGLLIYDECLNYTIGVNENARTNIKTHKWTTKYLGDKVDEVLWDREDEYIPSHSGEGAQWITHTGLYIARIKK